MSSPLDKLCSPGKPLQLEAPDAKELAGLLRGGTARLKDARNGAVRNPYVLASINLNREAIYAA
jgi:hypothetical protein